MTANKLEGKARELLAAECPECGGASGYMTPSDDPGGHWRRCGTCLDGDRIHSVSRPQALRAIIRALDTARQHEIRDHGHQHSCSYYCDRPECVKAQRDELREAYVARQSEGMVLVPRAATIGIRGVLYRTRSGYGDDYMTPEQADALWAELLAAAPADGGA